MSKKPRIDEARLKTAFAKLDQYDAAGKITQLRVCFDSTSGRPSWKTVKNYMADRKSAIFGTQVDAFARAMAELPELLTPTQEIERVAYSFVAKEIGIGDVEAYVQDIGHYVGKYQFFADPGPQIKLNRLFFIKKQPDRDSVVFSFNYMTRKHGQEKRNCDGFVFERNERVFFLGASPTSILYGAFTARPNPDKKGTVMYGVIAFEELSLQEVFFSQAALFSTDYEDNDLVEQNIKCWLAQPIVKV